MVQPGVDQTPWTAFLFLETRQRPSTATHVAQEEVAEKSPDDSAGAEDWSDHSAVERYRSVGDCNMKEFAVPWSIAAYPAW